MDLLDILPALITSAIALLASMAKRALLRKQIKLDKEIQALEAKRQPRKKREPMVITPGKPRKPPPPPDSSDISRSFLRYSPPDIC